MQHHKYFSSGRLTAAGPALDLADIGREDEGVYVCVADNQVSRPVTDSIALNVLCERESVMMGNTSKVNLFLQLNFHGWALAYVPDQKVLRVDIILTHYQPNLP